MTTSKQNQDRTGQLSTHNIFFIKQLSQWRSLSKNKRVASQNNTRQFKVKLYCNM